MALRTRRGLEGASFCWIVVGDDWETVLGEASGNRDDMANIGGQKLWTFRFIRKYANQNHH